jgi:hypothetical protein
VKSLVRQIPVRPDGAVRLLGDYLAGLLANAHGGHPEDDYMSLSVL